MEDIVGNTICADLIDYLARDFYNTGLPAGLGAHFLTYFFVTRDDDKDMPQRLALRLTKTDRTRGNRPDVVSEVMKYLRHRYELGERVLEHHTHVAADAMLGRAFEYLRDLVKEDRLEEILRTNGEDGLLERISASDCSTWLQQFVSRSAKKSVKDSGGDHSSAALTDRLAYRGFRDLIQDVLNRRLHQPIAVTKDQAVSGRLFGKYGSVHQEPKRAKERHALEAEAVRVAKLKNPWDVLLTVPSPKMRFKPAQVLVEVNGTTSTLVDSMLGTTARELGELHAGLWAVRVLVARDATEAQKDIVRAFLSHELGVEWSGLQEIGDDYVRVVVRQFVESQPNAGNLPRQIETQLLNACRAARGPNTKPRTAAEIRGVCEAILATIDRETRRQEPS